jgi:hypothetical protein
MSILLNTRKKSYNILKIFKIIKKLILKMEEHLSERYKEYRKLYLPNIQINPMKRKSEINPILLVSNLKF